jgi:hypothetical protein
MNPTPLAMLTAVICCLMAAGCAGSRQEAVIPADPAPTTAELATAADLVRGYPPDAAARKRIEGILAPALADAGHPRHARAVGINDSLRALDGYVATSAINAPVDVPMVRAAIDEVRSTTTTKNNP